MTTPPPGTAELVAECAALLPSLRWAPHESARTHALLVVVGSDGRGGHVIVQRCRVDEPHRQYLVEVGHESHGAAVGDTRTTGSAYAARWREAYSIARDRYDHARAVPRPEFPDVPR
jgi:hypothetical protein